MFAGNEMARRAGNWGVGLAALLVAWPLLLAPAWAESAPPQGAQAIPEQVAPAQENERAGKSAPDSPAVLVPPPIDPGIEAPIKTRTHDKMPVVPPPGTPGGDPNTIAK